jgi:hypothetical protein
MVSALEMTGSPRRSSRISHPEVELVRLWLTYQHVRTGNVTL